MACCVLAAMLFGRLLRALVFVGRLLSRHRDAVLAREQHPSPEVSFHPSDAGPVIRAPA
jgi:hypothetical protein